MVQNTSQTDLQRFVLPVIEGINKNFFSDFGHPEDDESFLCKSKLLTVRHAESEENVLMMTHEYGSPEGFSDDLIYNTLFDCHLS